jgi:hypothetical protein
MKPVWMVICACMYSIFHEPSLPVTSCLPTPLPQDTIRWSAGYKLTFSDFREIKQHYTGTTFDTTKFAVSAYSAVCISFVPRVEGKQLLFDAFALFVRSKSWMLHRHEAVLQHEQGHFDIAAIYARKLQQALQRFQDPALPGVKDSIYKVYNEIIALNKKEQEDYDYTSLTSIGRAYYYKKIAEGLKETTP